MPIDIPVTPATKPALDNGRALYNRKIGQIELEFCPFLLPEFVFTGHEITRGGEMEIPPEYAAYFQLITDNRDIFPGFFHIDLAGNVLPKLELLRQFGFYPKPGRKELSGSEIECCGEKAAGHRDRQRRTHRERQRPSAHRGHQRAHTRPLCP